MLQNTQQPHPQQSIYLFIALSTLLVMGSLWGIDEIYEQLLCVKYWEIDSLIHGD
jgi:hypothetical protein